MKNIGLLYNDGEMPSLSPAYDIVAYAAYHQNRGHALESSSLTVVQKGRLMGHFNSHPMIDSLYRRAGSKAA